MNLRRVFQAVLAAIAGVVVTFMVSIVIILPLVITFRLSHRPVLLLNFLAEVAMVAVGYFAARASWRRSLRIDRYTRFQCTLCGYSLRGNQSGICSECGQSTLLF